MATTNFDTSDPTSAAHYPPSQTALLLMDYHSYFIDNLVGQSGPKALATAVSAREWAKSLGIHVVHSLVSLNAPSYPSSKNKEKLAVIANDMKGHPGGYEEPNSLTDGAGADEPTFYKTIGKTSALTSPGLLEFLKEKDIKSLILMGLSTSGVVLRTSIPATDLEYVVTVVKDGCADRDQEVHDVIINKVLGNRAWVVSWEELRAGYKNESH